MITPNHKIVFLFSGQGSHYRGMGENLYKNYPAFTRSLDQSDNLIQQYLGQSIIAELYERKGNIFDELLLTHPAIIAIELAILDLMRELEILPDFVSGHSLGEFAAGVAAGIWTKESAIEAAIEQAISIVKDGTLGGMLTVIGESKDSLQSMFAKSQIYIASENFSKHFTLSGATIELDTFQQKLISSNSTFLKLPVAYPFHCPLIKTGKTGFLYYTYTSPQLNIPSRRFISGLFNQELSRGLPKEYFWQVISQPTNFCDFVNYMEALGPCLYLDLGPSGTSANFVKYNLTAQSNSIVHTIMTPYKRENVQLHSLQNLLKTIA